MARKYKPATFQPTIRPDWGGVLSYIPDDEKINILEALIKYPSIECTSKFWIETIKPDLDLQYEEFTRQCAAKSRGVRNRWGKTSITTLKDENKTSTTGVIVSERERIGIEERIKEQKQKNQVENQVENQVANQDMFQVADKDNIKNKLINYGELKKVCLTSDEYEKLKAKYGDLLEPAIEKLDGWIATTTKKIKKGSHYAYFKSDSWVWENLKPVVHTPVVPISKEREQENALARLAEITMEENKKRMLQKYGV